MTSTPDRLADFVSVNEPISDVYSAVLIVPEDVYREPVVLGVTDRRLVSLSDANELTSISLDHVTSIRSSQTTAVDYRGNDYRLLLAGSALLAVTGLSIATTVLSGWLATSLFLLVVAGLLVAYFGSRERPAEFTARIRDLEYWEVVPVDERHRLLVGGGTLTVLGLSGLVALAPTVLAAVLTLVVVLLLVASVWLADYAWRHRRDLDGIERVRTKLKEVRVGTDAGNTVSFLVDPDDDLDRTLSRGTYGVGTSDSRTHLEREEGLLREH
jgi:membrane protein implicated in regulation of membrane protease activity